jgi:hypothetical protein
MAIMMLHTRAAPRPHIHDDWVEWLITQHMPQLTDGSPLLGSWCYRSSPENNTARQHYMVNYVAPDVGSMMTWLDSRQLDAALSDGLRWIGGFDALEGDDFTGNVYIQTWASGRDQAYGAGPGVYVRRFESLSAENGPRWNAPGGASAGAQRLAERGDVSGVSLWAAERNVPVPYYRSAGNRMITCGLPGRGEAAGTGLPSQVEAALDAVQDLEGCSGYTTSTSYGLIASAPSHPAD